MNAKIGTEVAHFFFWEYLFQNFGIVSLQWEYRRMNLQDRINPNLGMDTYLLEPTEGIFFYHCATFFKMNSVPLYIF